MCITATGDYRTNMEDQKKYVGYIRVSTKKQGDSGAGLESQEAIIKAKAGDNLVKIFREIESTRKSNKRFEFYKALNMCVENGYVLCIAKIDRAIRDMDLLMSLEKAVSAGNLEFFICNRPWADKYTIRNDVNNAEQERQWISERTKAGLAVVKLRGTKTGKPYMPPRGFREDRARLERAIIASREAKTIKRLCHPEMIKSRAFMMELHNSGKSGWAIANELNKNGFKTSTGGQWRQGSVYTTLQLPFDEGIVEKYRDVYQWL